jgi:hypothetical protein
MAHFARELDGDAVAARGRVIGRVSDQFGAAPRSIRDGPDDEVSIFHSIEDGDLSGMEVAFAASWAAQIRSGCVGISGILDPDVAGLDSSRRNTDERN